MAVRKLSVALDERVAAEASASAASEGVSLSAWLDQAARQKLRVQKGLAAVAAWERRHGKLTPDELAAADAVLTRHERFPRR